MVSFHKIHVFPQLRGIGLLGTKTLYLHLQKHKLQEVFLSKTCSVLTGKQCFRCSFSITDGFLWRDTCVSSTLLNRPIWNEDSPQKPKLQEVFLSQTNSVLTGKQCARSSATNRDGYLWRDTCISSTQLNSPV
jgi:hypothetical protein